jgi:hypothetical protein
MHVTLITSKSVVGIVPPLWYEHVSMRKVLGTVICRKWVHSHSSLWWYENSIYYTVSAGRQEGRSFTYMTYSLLLLLRLTGEESPAVEDRFLDSLG